MALKDRLLGLVLLAGGSAGALPAPEPAEPRQLSAEFAVPERRLRQLHDEGMSYQDVRTALILSKETGLSLDEIAGLRKAGVPFDTIAARHRLDLGEVLAEYDRGRPAGRPAEKPREAVRSESEESRAKRLAARHGVTASEVRALRRKGLDWGEVERALEVASATGRTPAEVAELHESGVSWREIELRPTQVPAEDRPLWDSPANPAARDRWDAQHDWSYPRQRPRFPPEQLDERKERPSR